jgi:hypothetical protein
MVNFTGGPAAGESLILRRAPLLLRVVRSAAGEWDALDMLDDAPKPRESVHVYRMVADRGAMHLSYRTPGGYRRGTRSAWADYAYLADQPADADVRDTARWRAWCVAFEAAAKAAGATT